MATKQGLSAQFSQASEDAKRAIASRTKSSWFSNLNTTCTIKSAPPRTPEVLSLLSTKSGFLLKRNEQHVWQSRWCCVVPHMFLYYFDGDIGTMGLGGDAAAAAPSQDLQNELNAAISGGSRKTTGPRSSLNLFSPGGTTIPEGEAVTGGGATISNSDKFATLQPTGIIDLECYTSVHKTGGDGENLRILELAGDDSVNPDLRSFYFCTQVGEEQDDDEDWTQGLLGGRHSALVDERDAYKQVCDGFSQQLQQLHFALDQSDKKHSDVEEECYRIRSSQEEVRRKCFSLIQEALERDANNSSADSTGSNSSIYAQPRRAFRTDLETVRQQDMGLVPAVQLLSDFCAVLEESCGTLQSQVKTCEEQARHVAQESQKADLEFVWKQREQEWIDEKQMLQNQVKRYEKQLAASQKAIRDAQQDVASQKMEFTMYQSAQRSKHSEVQQHKKILKKEVIDLRQKLDEVGSELSLQKHHSKTSKLEAEQERRKAELLERYVEKMESQVKVQQNMMELMSHHGGETASRGGGSSYHGGENRSYHGGNGDRSYHGGVAATGGSYHGDVNNNSSNHNTINGSNVYRNKADGASPYGGGSYVGGSPNNGYHHKNDGVSGVMVVNTPSNIDDVHDEMRGETHSVLLRKAMADDDNKSHMSELTEDRTQKHFLGHEPTEMRRMPPTYIEGPRLPTKASSSSVAGTSLPPRGPDDSRSMASSSQRLSVAQRARLEAERSTTVRVRAPMPLVRSKSNSSQNSFMNNMARSISGVIDKSLLGVPDIDSSSNEDDVHNIEHDLDDDHDGGQEQQEEEEEEEDDSEEDENERPASEAGSASISLAERQQIQRAKQIAFLKQQGLLKNGGALKGGAGAASPRRDESSTSKRR